METCESGQIDQLLSNHEVGSSDHIWSRSEIDKMITRDPMIDY